MKFITSDKFRFNTNTIYPIIGLAFVDESGMIEVPEEKAGEFARFNKSFEPFQEIDNTIGSQTSSEDTIGGGMKEDLSKVNNPDILGTDQQTVEKDNRTETEREMEINFEEWKVADLKKYAEDMGLEEIPSKKDDLVKFLRVNI